MGAQESRQRQQQGGDDGTTEKAVDYYTLLGVEDNASADEIKVWIFFDSPPTSVFADHRSR